MNKLKSVFIIAINIAAASNMVYALSQLFSDGFSLAWLGVAIAALSVGGYFANLYLYRTPRTSPRLTSISLIVAGGAALAISGALMGAANGWRAVIYSLLMLALWLIYDFWYSRLGRADNNLLVVGETLPSFALQDANGNEVHSDSFRGQPALFMFYRGNWCPLCMAQIREVAGLYRELAERGVQTALISPQPHEHTRRLAQKFDVPFRFLVDVGNQVARQLHIVHENGIPAGFGLMGYAAETVYPTVIMTDASGKIILADLTDNYRLRPEPQTFLQLIDEQIRHPIAATNGQRTNRMSTG